MSRIITCAEDKGGNITWYLNSEPFEPTELEKVKYYVDLYGHYHTAFVEVLSDITTHPDFVWPDLKLKEKALVIINKIRAFYGKL